MVLRVCKKCTSEMEICLTGSDTKKRYLLLFRFLTEVYSIDVVLYKTRDVLCFVILLRLLRIYAIIVLPFLFH